ncbi:MAG TPA: TlpA disulfide reductase family protein [Solirubrobacteraceae bacterium]
MKRSAVPTVVLAAAAALVALLIYGVVSKGTDTTLDDAVKRGERPTAPGAQRALPLLGNDAAKRTLAQYHGKVVVLNFWASWCDPCKDEAPHLRATQARLAADDSGTVLGATYNDDPEKSRDFLREHKLDFPVVRDVGTKLANGFGTNHLPETFVLDRRGRIVAISRGVVTQEFLDDAVARAKRSA